jgi:hypothetical protein
VVLITERGALLAGHALAPLDQASIGRSCVRFKRLGDVDQNVLERLLRKAAAMRPPTPDRRAALH